MRLIDADAMLKRNKMELNTIYNEGCLEGMKRIPDGSIDTIEA